MKSFFEIRKEMRVCRTLGKMPKHTEETLYSHSRQTFCCVAFWSHFCVCPPVTCFLGDG